MLRIVLLFILFLSLAGSLPVWSFSRGWGYYPSGMLSILVIALLVIIFQGRSKV